MWVPPFLARPSHYTSAPNDRIDAGYLGDGPSVSSRTGQTHTHRESEGQGEQTQDFCLKIEKRAGLGGVPTWCTPTCAPDEQVRICAAAEKILENIRRQNMRRWDQKKKGTNIWYQLYRVATCKKNRYRVAPDAQLTGPREDGTPRSARQRRPTRGHCTSNRLAQGRHPVHTHPPGPFEPGRLVRAWGEGWDCKLGQTDAASVIQWLIDWEGGEGGREGRGEGGKRPRLSLTDEYVIWHVQKCQKLGKMRGERVQPFFPPPSRLVGPFPEEGSEKPSLSEGGYVMNFCPRLTPRGGRSGLDFPPRRRLDIRWGAVPAPALQVDRFRHSW